MNKETSLKRLLVISLLCLAVINAKAEEISQVFTAKVNAYQTQSFNKKVVFLTGLDKVLYKLTGLNKTLKDKRLAPLRNISNTLVQKFSAKTLTPLERRQWREQYLKTTGQKATKTPYSIITVSYAKKPIANYLKRNKIPFWSKIRPKSVYWIVENNENKPAIINKESDSKVKHYIFDIADALGLPITYPILDDLDLQRINTQMLKDSDINTVSLATQRYGAFNTVIVDITLIEDTYVVNWTAKIDNLTYVWDTQSLDLYKALELGVSENVAHILKTINEGIEIDTKQTVAINVSNVAHYQSMAIIKKYLNSLPKLSAVVLKHVSPTILQFDANLVGTLNNLKRYIRLQNIVAIDEPELIDIDKEELLYLEEESDIEPDGVVELNLIFQTN